MARGALLTAAALVGAVAMTGCGAAQPATTKTVTVTTEAPSTPPADTTADASATSPKLATTRSASSVRRRARLFHLCDANISVKTETTTCPFGQNAFYSYWTSGESASIEVYSPAARRTFDTACTARASYIVCTASDGGAVRFSQAAVDAYSQDQANAYAATANLGPTAPAPDHDTSGGSSTPETYATPDTYEGPAPDSPESDSADGFCTTHNCIPSYDEGNGYTVQCSDGSYSHSGGLQGACSQHGGVR